MANINLTEYLKSPPVQEISASPSSEFSHKKFEEVDVKVEVIDLYDASTPNQELVHGKNLNCDVLCVIKFVDAVFYSQNEL